MENGLSFFLGSLFLIQFPALSDEAEDLIRYYEKFNLDQAEQTIKSFLTAKTVDEKTKYVRDPERVGPLMKAYYAKGAYQPEGFESFNQNQVSYQKRLLTTKVQTADFLDQLITLERSPKNETTTYPVDWESWVGYSEKTPKEMKTEKPTTPFMVRARVKNADYYNFDFSDDSKWKSLTLLIGNSDESFTGYTPTNSKLHQVFPVDQEREFRLILKVAYPKGAKNDRQLIITELIESDGWILPPKEKEDEKDAPKAQPAGK